MVVSEIGLNQIQRPGSVGDAFDDAGIHAAAPDDGRPDPVEQGLFERRQDDAGGVGIVHQPKEEILGVGHGPPDDVIAGGADDLAEIFRRDQGLDGLDVLEGQGGGFQAEGRLEEAEIDGEDELEDEEGGGGDAHQPKEGLEEGPAAEGLVRAGVFHGRPHS